MADVHTPEQRSYNMFRIHSKNTKPEEFGEEISALAMISISQK